VTRDIKCIYSILGLLHTGCGKACLAAEVGAYGKAILDWLPRNASLCATELRAVSKDVGETLASADVIQTYVRVRTGVNAAVVGLMTAV